MMPARRALPAVLLAALLALAGLGAGAVSAQQAPTGDDVGETRRAVAAAQAEGRAAAARADRLETEATRVTAAADRTAREAAAIAARIQQAEAEIAGQEASIRLIAREQQGLRARLAERQRPLVRLTAALQRLSRRPPVLALMRPGSVRDTMHMRAMLETMLPEITRRTAALRGEIARGQALQQQARTAARDLRESEASLQGRRRTLAALETRQRLESREATGQADREAERALALAEQARDLGTLAEALREAGALREQLAQLPGPIMRPARPETARVDAAATGNAEGGSNGSETPPAPLGEYMLPVAGRLVSGFGEAQPNGPRIWGMSLAPRPGAQLVAPAAGRVAFAGLYRGYGNIVIIEHAGGWTSLLTGLAKLDTRVGTMLLAGSPLGIAGPVNPVVTVELRRGGTPVNPLDHVSKP